ncbi:MAG: hypothetical protein ACXV5T_07840, partial [Halobacteriota archaeon]
MVFRSVTVASARRKRRIIEGFKEKEVLETKTSPPIMPSQNSKGTTEGTTSRKGRYGWEQVSA